MTRLARILLDGVTARDDLGRLMANVGGFPRDVQREVGHELWRMNRRSWRLWAGVALFGGFAVGGAWLGSMAPVPRPAAPGLRSLGPGVGGLLGTALGMVPFTLLARPVAALNLRTIFAQRSLCPACGYDLRATPDRCPECGAVPSAR